MPEFSILFFFRAGGGSVNIKPRKYKKLSSNLKK